MVPEIVITHSDQSREFIDAKRSTRSATNKDLVIYPSLAKKVTFWCLYGDSKDLSDQDTPIVYTSSDDLISLLTDRRNENKKVVLKWWVVWAWRVVY